jgi:quercetin dioxygenase-like cupin family protein
MPERSEKTKSVVRTLKEVAPVAVEQGKGATIRVLLGPDQGMPNFHVRLFEIAPGGFIPEHRHDVLEHGQHVLKGKMVLILDGEERPVSAGDSVLIPAGVAHRYENRGKTPVQFLCVIPKRPYSTEWIEAKAGC